MPLEAARIEPVRLGKTFRQHWESLDTVGRNELLRVSEVRAYVEPWEGRPVDLSVTFNGQVNVLFDRPVDSSQGDGRAITMYGHGIRIVLDLGNLARDMAAAT
jgi:hypothetical protein